MATSTKTPYDSDADEKHAPKPDGDAAKDSYRDAGAVGDPKSYSAKPSAVGDPKSYSAKPSDEEKRQAAAQLDRDGGYYAPESDLAKKEAGFSSDKLARQQTRHSGWGFRDDDAPEEKKEHYRNLGYIEGKDGGFYLPLKEDPRGSRLSRGKSARKVWKKYAVGGGIVAVIMGIAFSIIGFFLPLKLEFIIKNLDESLSSATDYAVGERVDALVGRYMSLKIFGAVSENVYIGNTLTGTIYGNWLKSNLEATLRDKHGIEFRALDRQNRPTRGTQRTAVKWQVIAKGRASPFINTTSVNLKRLDAREFRQVVKQAIRSETRWNQVIKRYHQWRVIRSAYAVPNRFIPKFATEARASYTEKKIAIKKWLVTRTVTPFSSRLGALMACMVDARTCNDIVRRDTFNRSTLSEAEINIRRAEIEDLNRQISEIDPVDPNYRAVLNDLDGRVDTITKELRASGLSDVDVDRIIRETFDELGPDAAKREVYKRLSKVFSSKLTKGLLITVTGLGLVDLLSDIDLFFSGGAANKAMYQMQSLALINQTAPFLTVASQLKLGDLPAEDLGIFMESYDDFQKSVVYGVENGLFETGAPLSFLGGDVSALAKVIPYDCDGDGVIAEYTKESVDYVTLDEPVCAGMRVGKDMRGITKEPWYANSVGVFFSFYRSTIGGFVGWAVDLFDAAVGFFIGPILDAIGASKAIASGMEYVLERVVSPACNGLEEGALAYDCLRGGLELANNAVNEDSLDGTGGEYLKPTDRNAVVAYMQAQHDEEWRQQPLFARLFSTDSHRSLLAQTIVRTPSSAQSAMSNVASALASPFRALGSVFDSLASPIFARSADLPDNWNPYGVVHYGYKLGDENLAAEPGTGVFADCTTDEGVAASLARRENSLRVPDDAEDYLWPVYTEPDYCALEKTALEAASALLGGGI